MRVVYAKTQQGFSLIELMVALTISLVLLAGLFQILLGNKQSFKVQQATAELQENARLVSFVLENVVAHAGYKNKLRSPNRFIFPADGAGDNRPAIGSGEFVSGSDGGKDANDTLRIRFEASGGLNDCFGNSVGTSADPTDNSPPTSQTADIALYVKVWDKTNTPALYCNNINRPAETPQPLVNYVDRFNVRYGLDTNSDNAVDTYSDTPIAGQVRSVRVQLLLQSNPDIPVIPTASKRHYAVAGDTGFATDTNTLYPNNSNRNRVAYQMVDQTIALRNALP